MDFKEKLHTLREKILNKFKEEKLKAFEKAKSIFLSIYKSKKVRFTVASMFILGIVMALSLYVYFSRNLPSIKTLSDYKPLAITNIYASNGDIIAQYYKEKRKVVPYSRVPRHVIEAFIASEDSNFFEHSGIDYLGIFRAFIKNMQAGRIVQGGSTITQQVAKSFFLSPERKITRKAKEAILAYRIEKYLSKDEILFLYLNQIFFGSGAYGIQVASETYFNKDVEDLTLAEGAVLAGLPKAPSRYSPYNNFERSKKRQKLVLKRMVAENYITIDEAELAFKEKLLLEKRQIDTLWRGQYFTEDVRKYLVKKYGKEKVYTEEMHIYTAMDVDMQRAANDAVFYGLKDHDKRQGYRGSLNRIENSQDLEILRKEIKKSLKGKKLEVNETYKAIVTSVDVDKKRYYIEVGDYKGQIREYQIRWAKRLNPSHREGEDITVKWHRVLKTGDVILATVRKEPRGKSEIYDFTLEQDTQAQASLLAKDPKTGHIKAIVGGSDYGLTKYNRATQAKRQPGSSFKPIIYATALDSGYTQSTIVIDSPLVFEQEVETRIEKEIDINLITSDTETNVEENFETTTTTWFWKPQNYSNRYHGPTTVRQALTKSRNIVTIKVLQDVGVRKTALYAKKLGIDQELNKDLSMALGSTAVTLQEMVNVFGTFANQGIKTTPLMITYIIDREGAILEENTPIEEEAISPETAYIVTDLLQSVVQNGTGRRARVLGRPLGGKTGTTNSLNDAWFLGISPEYAVGAWIGYDNEQSLGRYETGSRAALPIWIDFMTQIYEGKPVTNFPVPENIEFAKIDTKTGLLANRTTEKPVFAAYKFGTMPMEKVSQTKDKIPGQNDFFFMDTANGVTKTNDESASDDPLDDPLMDDPLSDINNIEEEDLL